MMKTRRKSKAVAAAAEQEQGQASAHASEESTFTVSIPDDIDLDALSNLLPGFNLTSSSPEAVEQLYKVLLVQASDINTAQRDLDESRAEVEKKEIELDQALQDRESLSKELETSLEGVHNELKQITQERDQLAGSQAALQAQIISLSTSQSSSSTEVDTLHHRVEDIEREKRDLVGVISRLKQESTQREEEIQTLRTNLKEARQEHQGLEAQVRELRSTETSAKFKLDSLTQQLQLAQSELDRTNGELTSKSEEFAKYRRGKHAEVVTIQASFDSLTQTHASTSASLKALQSAHTAQTHQLTQALSRVQDLTGQLAEQEATYSSEASGLRRLVGMMEEREKQAKEIVEGIEREWAGVGDKAERREAELREAAERERRGREEAEKRLDQLETVLERMGRGELPIPGRTTGGPGTPSGTPGTPDLLMDGMLGLSPTVAMASKSQRGGKTFTEVYADYVQLQDDFARKSAEYDHMDRTLSDVLAQIEERAPILSQQRIEYERLQSEAAQLSSQLAQAIAERDSQATIAQDTSQKLSKTTRENGLLQKQLEDLGRQVHSLLREISRRDDPTIPADDDLEQLPPLPAENIEEVITNNLVLFRSIGGLQEQNQKLLRIVRELGSKMEAEEKEYREALEREQGEAVREAHEAMQELAGQLERQKRSSEGIIQAYMKERDALKAMLSRAERAAGSGAYRGMNGDINGAGDGIVGGAGSTDLAKELAEIQSQFEAYRTEMGVDSVRLREDVVLAQRESGQLGAALAKANAKIEYLTDRHRISQEQFAMQGRELDDLTKRNQQLLDQWTRIDIECSRATEDLQVANGRVEQLRNECANLRAEKKIWESVQGRLVEENRILAMERSHLSDLMSNVQKMHHDLERSGENDRRRLENQLQMLEGQTQDLRTQLYQERDSVRHISLQKDVEVKDLQGRLDKAAQELSKTRESLVGAQTSQNHLEVRVEELARQLQGNEEKLAVYERRPSLAKGIAQNTDQSLNHEQQLEAEVAELRSALKLTEVDLATAKSHVSQFQEISQANESALAALNTTYDEYKASTETQIARHESEYASLNEKLGLAQEELSQLRANYKEFQKTFETERTAWANDKKTLEDTIVDMSTSEKHSESDRTSRENEVRQQEERARAAEERYSREVIAHAESIKAIETLKRQFADVQVTARDNQIAADTAVAKLAASEVSWKQQKEALDKEVMDLNTRCQDLSSQNTILHQHLESVSSQAARIRQAADATSIEPGEGETSDEADTKLSELRSVVAYLRKEKEIVDLQLELSKQENARLKAQIDHLSQSLESARTTLSEERERAVETAASAAQHAELLDRINQLNILRESNATLRGDCETYAKRARDLESKLQQLSAELDPAKERVRIANAELEARDAQLKRLEEESRRWQERNTQLLSKYDRVDPAEVQALKDEIEQLKLQKAALEQADAERNQTISNQKERVEALENNLRTHKEAQAKNNQAFRQKLGELNAERSRLLAEKQKHEVTITALELENSTLQAAKSALDAETASKTQSSSEQVSNQASIIASLREERDKLLAEKAAGVSIPNNVGASNSTLDDAKHAWDAEKAELIKARDEAVSQAKIATEQAQKAVQEAKSIRFSNEKFQSKIQDLSKARAADNERAIAQQEAAVSAAIDRVKSDMQTGNLSVPGDVANRHAEVLHAQEQALAAKHKEELRKAVEAAVEAARNEKAVLSSEVDQKAAIDAAVAAHEKELQKRHAEEIASAVERGRMEQVAKGKLKDSQLVKAQKKVKELETQILEWRNAGLLPEATAPSSATASASTTANPPPTPTAPTASNPAALNPTAGASLPRKPSLNTPTGPAADGAGRGIRGAARGVGRGVVRGGLNIRGAAPGRGIPISPAAANPGSVSIMGAAAKRPREEPATTSDDSLAKRLKPAEPTGKPVTLRRPPP